MKKTLLIISFILLAFLIIGWFLPKGYDVNRQIKIKAKASEIQFVVNDLENWKGNWGSWQGGDTSVINSIGDQTKGVGANQSWRSKNGGGKIVFTKSDKDGLEYDISFDGDSIKCKGYINYKEEKEFTTVTWGIKGNTPNPILGGYLALMMDSLVSGIIRSDLHFLKKFMEKTNTKEVALDQKETLEK